MELKRINQILTQRSCARTELVVWERAIKISEVSKHARKKLSSVVIFLSWDISLVVPVYGLNEEPEPNSLS